MLINLIIPALITAGFLVGIHLMQSPRTALWGNRLGALCMLLALVFVFLTTPELRNSIAWLYLLFGGIAGIAMGQKIKMIQMPQAVALLNGFGGGASALVAGTAMAIGAAASTPWLFWFTAALALAIGTLTFSGSLVAALKLQGWISQRPQIIGGHSIILFLLLLIGLFLVLLVSFTGTTAYLLLVIAVFICYGLLMAVRVGGADMPVIISFLNSLSGVAASVSGLAVGNILLAGVGALVGVAGMILTQLMCRAMNRNLFAVLGGFRTVVLPISPADADEKVSGNKSALTVEHIPALLNEAQKIVIVPGYGMALAQAQQAVKELADALESRGKEVKMAVHPVAGRMPGHMNVLLAEVGIDYDKLYDMEAINPLFSETDLVIVIGACDVINPAASTAEGTPIYGMPILKAFEATHIIVCNLDEKPGYSGVENTLYLRGNVVTLWGNAAETVPGLTAAII
ncbi:MAG TPA: NAD(P)(+) transhydrogenase (Re/Si-specific) subunit beta [Candidatus Limnocylindrales bacterium]|nr:NAD(P)(+) transhydrogenase (Re/Si-specific) subunit beta [Candidatus Limnocylindrales bacterium]